MLVEVTAAAVTDSSSSSSRLWRHGESLHPSGTQREGWKDKRDGKGVDGGSDGEC